MTARSPAEVEATDVAERLAEAYRCHGAAVARTIAAYTGEPSMVEDLLNETFIRAVERIEDFEDRSTLETWLHGIALNVARAHVAKRTRRRRIDAALPPGPGATAAVDEDVGAREAVRVLYRALDALSEPLREAFVLCVLEARTLQDASRRSGVAVSTLHARRQRAEAFVRARLEGDR
ncbi:MAG: RNA polymerase sigma factor [Nannocystaceae bacterium]|nr:RNA polymerase sigma factor [bacterium]